MGSAMAAILTAAFVPNRLSSTVRSGPAHAHFSHVATVRSPKFTSCLVGDLHRQIANSKLPMVICWHPNAIWDSWANV